MLSLGSRTDRGRCGKRTVRVCLGIPSRLCDRSATKTDRVDFPASPRTKGVPANSHRCQNTTNSTSRKRRSYLLRQRSGWTTWIFYSSSQVELKRLSLSTDDLDNVFRSVATRLFPSPKPAQKPAKSSPPSPSAPTKNSEPHLLGCLRPLPAAQAPAEPRKHRERNRATYSKGPLSIWRFASLRHRHP